MKRLGDRHLFTVHKVLISMLCLAESHARAKCNKDTRSIQLTALRYPLPQAEGGGSNVEILHTPRNAIERSPEAFLSWPGGASFSHCPQSCQELHEPPTQATNAALTLLWARRRRARALMAAVMTGSTSRGDAACPAYLQNGAAVRTWSSSWNAPLSTSFCGGAN